MTMENSDDIRLIVKIAQLYYEQDMTQAQIARELGIYRTTISRLLKRGRGPAWRPACRSVAGARRYHRFFMGPRRAFAGGEPAAGQPVTPGDLRPHHRWTFR